MKVYNELRSMSPFNPLYSSVCSQCKANLEKVRSHESMSVEMFQEIQHTLSDVTFLYPQFNTVIIFLETNNEEISFIDADSFLAERDQLCKSYALIKRERKTRKEQDFSENLGNLFQTLQNEMEADSEDFWQHFFVLRSLISFTNYDSSNYHALSKEVPTILNAYSYFCKRKAKLFDTFFQERMAYFGDVSRNYNSIDLAEAFMVREYLTNYQGDELYNYFFDIIAPMIQDKKIEVIDLKKLEGIRCSIAGFHPVWDVAQFALFLNNNGFTEYYWILDTPLLEVADKEISEAFTKMDNFTVSQDLLQQWILQLDTSVMLLKNEEEILAEFDAMCSLLEKFDVDVTDQSEFKQLIVQKWKGVHLCDSSSN